MAKQQECTILVIHGSRASFFPSPYVDAHGERQRHSHRGRPLFLDERRYSVVRGLWAKHLVAHEVHMGQPLVSRSYRVLPCFEELPFFLRLNELQWYCALPFSCAFQQVALHRILPRFAVF